MRYSSRLFLYGPFVLLLVLALAAVLHWWNLANDFERRLAEANRGREIAPGVTLHFASEAIDGCPFNLDAVLNNATLVVKATRGPFVWHSDRFAIHALTYGRAQEIFEAAGTQSLSWTDMEGEAHRFGFVPGSLRASAIARAGRLLRFDLDLDGIGARELQGARAQLHLRQSAAQDAIDIVASADALHLAPDLQTGFGADIARVSIAGRIRPATGLTPLLSGMAEWRTAAEAWRLGGGSLVLDRLDLAAGRIEITGTGMLSLNSRHIPDGALDLAIVHSQDIAPPDGYRFARALLGLSKADLQEAPLHVLVTVQGDAATVARASRPDTRVGAGSVDPLY